MKNYSANLWATKLFFTELLSRNKEISLCHLLRYKRLRFCYLQKVTLLILLRLLFFLKNIKHSKRFWNNTVFMDRSVDNQNTFFCEKSWSLFWKPISRQMSTKKSCKCLIFKRILFTFSKQRYRRNITWCS